MKRTILCLMLVSGLLATVLVIINREPVSGRSRLGSETPDTELDPFVKINNRARAAKSGDPSAVRALVTKPLILQGWGFLRLLLTP